MAVAEKKPSEVSSAATPSPFDRVAVASLVGVVYVLGCLGVVFKAVPAVWAAVWPAGGFMALTLQTIVMIAAATALLVLGTRLAGPKMKPGVKAGVFFGLLFLLTVVLLTRWVSLWVEHWVYFDGWFGDNGPTVGTVLVLVALGGWLYLFGRWFFRPGFERFLVRFEGQGWFSATAYKPQQGQKVRRGTILGILLLAGAGVYTMLSHNVLARYASDWSLGIPFTGTTVGIAPGDFETQLAEKFPKWKEQGVPSYEFRSFAAAHSPGQWVRIETPTEVTVYETDTGKEHTYKHGDLVERAKLEEVKKKVNDLDKAKLRDEAEVKKLNEGKTEGREAPSVVSATPATGRMQLAALTLLPHLKFTLPLLIMAASLWFAWRVVNQPVFADFLIATEAELNKVSWTTRRRLFQDTIVVLVTVVLMSVFLFVTDQVWLHLLSWDRINVIQVKKDQQTVKPGEKPRW